MKLKLISGLVVLSALGCALLWSCTVDRPSDKLACTSAAQCSGGRICSNGYCVIGTPDAALDAPADAFACPPACNSCEAATGTCRIDGTGSGAITCPSGWNCAITCSTSGACGDITCSGAKSCDIQCTAGNACGNVTCGTGRCSTKCTGALACGTIGCANSCRCDVTCNPILNECGTMTCPPAPGQHFCTTNGNTGQACFSSYANACHSC